MDSKQPSTERRRSARLAESLPLVVRGIDLLGQPFEERTATLNFNFHGCRYTSKHHLPKNTWLTIELPKNSSRRSVRARVAWIQRPHSVREFFQIAVELESPENVWGLDSPPADWTIDVPPYHSTAIAVAQKNPNVSYESNIPIPTTLTAFMGKLMTDMKDSSFEASGAESAPGLEFTPPADSPFLRELRTELDRHAARAVENASTQARERINETAAEIEQRHAAMSENSRKWLEEFEKAQSESRERLAADMAGRQDEFLSGLRTEFAEHFERARDLMAEFDQKAKALREESEIAQQTASRMAQARLQIEASEAVRTSKASAQESKERSEAFEGEAGAWRERLQSEMNLAQAQWNELLQSSLDSSLQRLVQQLSERSQEVQQASENKLTGRFADLLEPFSQSATEARETLTSIKSSLLKEIAGARTSLEEIEQSAVRIRENSTQFEAASHDSLNELHRRLENMLDAQTTEMTRRIEALAAAMSQRITPTIEAMGDQQVQRVVTQMEAKLAPHLERVPALLRELAAREVQVEEGLRLHRERLRQVSENIERDASSRMISTLSDLHREFEEARKDSLAKWNEELDAAGVRASHSATESLGRASEWFQQETRARLQVLVEHALASANTGFDEKTAEATRQFEERLAEQASKRLGQIGQELEGVGDGVAHRTRTQLGAAAEVAAASFGEVLRGISDQEIDFFSQRSRTALQERSQEFEQGSSQILHKLESDARLSVERFHSEIGSQLEARLLESRSALGAEFAAAIDRHRVESEAQQRQWGAKLENLNSAAEAKYQERLETTTDSWSVSSVRRLNEHGQNVIESLMRSADQSLRDSFAKIFDGMSEMLRDRASGNAGGITGFTPPASLEGAEKPAPRNDASKSSTA